CQVVKFGYNRRHMATVLERPHTYATPEHPSVLAQVPEFGAAPEPYTRLPTEPEVSGPLFTAYVDKLHQHGEDGINAINTVPNPDITGDPATAAAGRRDLYYDLV